MYRLLINQTVCMFCKNRYFGDSCGAFGLALNSSGEYSQRRIKSFDEAS